MRGNADNLRPFDELSEDERRTIRQAGGRASGAARRKKRELKEVIKLLLSEEITNKKGETATRREAMALNLLNKAISGDVKAVKLVAELANEMPAQQMEVAVSKVTKPAIVFRDPAEDMNPEGDE